MKQKDLDQLKLEIAHIFESGANEVRILHMVVDFIEKRYTHSLSPSKEVLDNSPEPWIPQVGEWVIMTGDYSDKLEIGKAYKILKNQRPEGSVYFVLDHEGEDSYLAPSKDDFRKALPNEIPAPEPKEHKVEFVKIETPEQFREAEKIIGEPKGYCIKRTPENAEVLNKWANKNMVNDITTSTEGYILSKSKSGQLYEHTGKERFYTELFTVEEFFEKVGYKPERQEAKEQIESNTKEAIEKALAEFEKVSAPEQPKEESDYVSSIEEENEECLQKIEYLDVAGAIAGFKFKPKDLDMIVSIYDLFLEFGGKLDLDTISKAKFDVEERHLPTKLEE